MSVPMWAVVVAVGWLLIAVVVGLVMGRVMRYRNQQYPVAEPRPRKPPHVPPTAPRTGARKTIPDAVHRGMRTSA